MRIVKNLIKYVLGLPILLFVTFAVGILGFMVFVLGEDVVVIIDTIKDVWKPLK